MIYQKQIDALSHIKSILTTLSLDLELHQHKCHNTDMKEHLQIRTDKHINGIVDTIDDLLTILSIKETHYHRRRTDRSDTTDTTDTKDKQ